MKRFCLPFLFLTLLIQDVLGTETSRFTSSGRRKVELLSNLSNQISFRDNFNVFTLDFRPKGAALVRQAITCLNPVSNRPFDIPFDNRGLQAQADLDLRNSQLPLEVEVTCWLKSHPQERVTHKLTRGLMVSGTTVLSSLIGNKRQLTVPTLLLDVNAVLITQGTSVRIRANELIALKSKIMTYPEITQDRPSEQLGLSGGHIYINARKIVGELHLELRGQNKDPSSKTVGGDTGSLEMEVLNLNAMKLKISYFPGTGYLPGNIDASVIYQEDHGEELTIQNNWQNF